MVTRDCDNCGELMSYSPVMLGNREVFTKTKCDKCCRALQIREDLQREMARKVKLDTAWDGICPPLYRDTDLARVPDQFAAAVTGWTFGPRGIGFSGSAGKCKTRCAFQLLMGQHFAGKGCRAVSATRLAALCAAQFSDDVARKYDAMRQMDEFRTVSVLLIDDLGKAKMTERAELELFDILETRTSHLLPTIWTANATAATLRKMMSDDRGEPIMRRLAEFTDIVTAL